MATPLHFIIIYKVKAYTPEKSYTIPERIYINHTFTYNNRVVFSKDLKKILPLKYYIFCIPTLKICLVDRGYSTILLQNI